MTEPTYTITQALRKRLIENREPVQVRDLLRSLTPNTGEPVAREHRKPVVDSNGICIGYTDWIRGPAPLAGWPTRDLFDHPAPSTKPVEPIYQSHSGCGRWMDQTKESYNYYLKHSLAPVRIVYLAAPVAPAHPQSSEPAPASGKRAAVFECLKRLASVHGAETANMLVDAADMLAADEDQIALYEGTLESRERNIADLMAEIARLLAQHVAVPQERVNITPEMEAAGNSAWMASDGVDACRVFNAMLAAAPQPPQAAQETKRPTNCGTGHCSCIECVVPGGTVGINGLTDAETSACMSVRGLSESTILKFGIIHEEDGDLIFSDFHIEQHGAKVSAEECLLQAVIGRLQSEINEIHDIESRGK